MGLFGRGGTRDGCLDNLLVHVRKCTVAFITVSSLARNVLIGHGLGQEEDQTLENGGGSEGRSAEPESQQRQVGILRRQPYPSMLVVPLALGCLGYD